MMRDPVRSTLSYVPAFLRNEICHVELTYTLHMHIQNMGYPMESEPLSHEAVQALQA